MSRVKDMPESRLASQDWRQQLARSAGAAASVLATPGQWPRLLMIGLVRFYRYWLQPWLGHVCPYQPSCSAYALQALQLHGAAQGAALSGWRLLRCNPWCSGGCDPVPPAGELSRRARGLFSRLLPAGASKVGAAVSAAADTDAAPSPAGHRAGLLVRALAARPARRRSLRRAGCRAALSAARPLIALRPGLCGRRSLSPRLKSRT